MAKRETIEEGLAPMPTLNNLKADLERKLRETSASFSVQWFLNLVESHQKLESPHVVTRAGKRVWDWPYETRVVHLLRTYLSLDVEFQQLIVAASEDNIYWRGDDIKFFMMVISEVDKMRAIGVEKYRELAQQKMQTVL